MPGIRLSSALAAVIVLSAACSKPLTVEQQIIAAIREMEALVEAGERRPFMGYLTEDFTAQRGSMNRDQLRALLIMQLNRYRRLEARLFPIRVAETGEETATAEFGALVTGGPGWIPESGQVYEFKTRWRLVDGDWLLQAADWEPVPLEAVL